MRRKRVTIEFGTDASEQQVSDRFTWLVNDYVLKDCRGEEYNDLKVDEVKLSIIDSESIEPRNEVERTLDDIKALDAEQFEEVVHGMAIAARTTARDSGDPAWYKAQELLKHAAIAIRERRGN